jgi:hypothetical protein
MIHTDMSPKIMISQTNEPDGDPVTIITIYHNTSEPTIIRVPTTRSSKGDAATLLIKARGHEPFVL